MLSPMKAEIKKTAQGLGSLKGGEEHFKTMHGLGYGEIGRTGEEPEPVFLGTTGVGKVLTSLAVQELIIRLAPRIILFGGIGGGVAEDLETGSMVIARDVVQWDMDASEVGVKKGKVPFLKSGAGIHGQGAVELDRELQEAALTAGKEYTQLRKGRIATGDTFLGKNSVHVKEMVRREFEADVVDMEGWSAACVCAVYDTPLLLLRIVSDTLQGGRPKDIRKFLSS
ncbi:MAG: 5'-methylthioadenosine/S-adenosylhomocysteine nucleosidase, partial [Spirochaetia bacterium]